MDHPEVATDRRREPRAGSSVWGDFLYDAFYGGAIGGSAVALVSLVIDAVRFEPLFTPSLLGSVLFLGVDAGEVSRVRLDMVAGFTAIHLMVFGALGMVISALVQRLHELAFHPVVVSVIILVLLQGGFMLADAVLLGGVVAVIGFWWIALVNLAAGVSMGLFLLNEHREAATTYVDALPSGSTSSRP